MAAAAERESKNFFSEKKQQKTSAHGGRWPRPRQIPQQIKFFLLLFFQKKKFFLPSTSDSQTLQPQASRIGRPDWTRDGKDWPNRPHSRFPRAAGLRWHVQVAGAGPVFLLLHGTGAATHSWRDLLPILAAHYTVVAPDLPGHGFTDQPDTAGMSLPGMAQGVAALLQELQLQPAFCAGHSAGAAVLAQMCLDGLIAPRAMISLNGALLPFKHAVSPLIAPLAKIFARSPLVPFIFSMHAADPRVVDRLLRGTGSVIDADGAKFYARLAARSGHAGAALTMMANWDLPALQKRLADLRVPVLLLAGGNDRSIPPEDADRLARLLPAARAQKLGGLGHLAHEEQPEDIARLMRAFCEEHAA
jgi:magnesium chelatase accessory protein